jgi:glycosyltransferase involved in cell wall biosynthesis
VTSGQTQLASERRKASANETQLELSVVLPVFNQADAIADNIEIIRQCLSESLGDTFELIVVSDGSIDETEERMLEARAENVRTIHYDRNLGKGYAVKIGALEGRGRWIAFMDADLDLHPSRLPEFLRAAEAEQLDFAIGSKRHPESDVFYPRSRRAASWLYQQLVHLLFHLDVRDTQVGMKLFRKEIADQVIPLLVVKQYAFDLELLAVSHALGFRRIRELPVTLDYQFTGSGVRSLAVLQSLVDTAAIFYRLRILRYYQRKQRLLAAGLERPARSKQRVTIITTEPAALAALDWLAVDIIPVDVLDTVRIRAAALAAKTDVLAFVGPGVRPAANWLSATVPYLTGAGIAAAVVAPKMAPTTGTLLERGAAAVCESRFGGGALYFRHTPGNLRLVDDFPEETMVVRRDRFLELGDVALGEVCGRLVDAGSVVVYTPDTVLADRPEPLFGPRFREAGRYGIRRGRHVRERSGARVRPTTLLPVALLLFLAVAPAAFLSGGFGLGVWLAAAIAYVAALAACGFFAALRFRSLAVGAVSVVGLVGTHVAFGAGFVRGLLRH